MSDTPQISLDQIKSEPKPEATSQAVQEKVGVAKSKTKSQLATERIEIENKRLEHENKRLEFLNHQLESDERLRQRVATGIFRIVIAWLTAVWAVVVLQMCPWFVKLSDPALIGLLVTTTANVILLLHTVVRYLFPRASIEEKSSRPNT